MGNCNNKLSENARRSADSYRSKWHSPDDCKWGYGRERGPANWWVYFPQANGHNQSPININPEDAEFDSDLKTYPLKINYMRDETRTLVNTGHGWQVNINKSRSYVTGGPAQANKYYLEQFHMHWGDRDDCGSEHTIHGRAFSGEIHFVHYNSKYGSFRNAFDQSDGLLVLGVFVKVNYSGHCSSGLELIASSISSYTDNIMYKDNNLCLKGLDIASLFPGDTGQYWVYNGSLTTPPCLETVQWLVFFEPVPITSQQLNAFRSLRSHKYGEIGYLDTDEFGGRIVKNYRPIQNLAGRKIWFSEHIFSGWPEFDEQFHKQNLFHKTKDFNCQFHRQGLL